MLKGSRHGSWWWLHECFVIHAQFNAAFTKQLLKLMLAVLDQTATASQSFRMLCFENIRKYKTIIYTHSRAILLPLSNDVIDVFVHTTLAYVHECYNNTGMSGPLQMMSVQCGLNLYQRWAAVFVHNWPYSWMSRTCVNGLYKQTCLAQMFHRLNICSISSIEH